MAQPLVCNASSQDATHIKKDGLNALGHFSFPYPWNYLTRSKMKKEGKGKYALTKGRKYANIYTSNTMGRT
jgi:hypothetical protein